MSVHTQVKQHTTKSIQQLKQQGRKISMLTAYDFTMAQIVDAAGTDIILVGDSAANVMAGHQTTVPITLGQMVYHCQCVSRAVKQALLVADLPFGTYQASQVQAFKSATCMLQQGGAQAIKIEGGSELAATIKHLVNGGIPVMGHLGLTPQSVFKFGGYGLRAAEDAEAEKLLQDALLLQDAGCFAIVLEKIPATLAARVTESLVIPTIGIGAGSMCSGQVLVLQDMLGMGTHRLPKFVRVYAQLQQQISSAVQQYISDVQTGAFPAPAEEY